MNLFRPFTIIRAALPELHPDWKRILTRAWSIRLLALAGVLSALEFLLPYIATDPRIPALLFRLLSIVVITAATISRIIAQKEFSNDR